MPDYDVFRSIRQSIRHIMRFRPHDSFLLVSRSFLLALSSSSFDDPCLAFASSSLPSRQMHLPISGQIGVEAFFRAIQTDADSRRVQHATGPASPARARGTSSAAASAQPNPAPNGNNGPSDHASPVRKASDKKAEEDKKKKDEEEKKKKDEEEKKKSGSPSRKPHSPRRKH